LQRIGHGRVTPGTIEFDLHGSYFGMSYFIWHY
jgi:hypothetical protein